MTYNPMLFGLTGRDMMMLKGCPGLMALLITLAGCAGSFAQTNTTSQPIRAQIELGTFGSTAQSPAFWLRSNQYGIIPLTPSAATVRAGIWKDYRPNDTTATRSQRFGWGFGLNPVVNAGGRSQVLLPEAYAKVKYGAMELYAGRRRELIGLGDSTLSSGFMIGSGNALPIPKVQLGTVGFVPLKFLKSFLAVKAAYVHGWFNTPYIQGAYWHQKYLYLRFGKPGSAFKAYGGLNHQVTWGGHGDYLVGSPVAVNGKLPSSFKYYGNVILANVPKQWDTSDYTSFDGAYRIGNHVGSWDFAFELNTRKATWMVYHQHPFEDVSGLLFLNIPDGLYGLSWKPKGTESTAATFQLRHVVAEMLTTMNQSGSTFWIANSRYQGADNYFDHGQYREGWSYFSRTIGTPFIAPRSDFRPELNERSPGGGFFPNNRINAWYVGAEGSVLNQVTLGLRLSYSRNYGTFTAPYTPVLGQFSSLLSAQTLLFPRYRTFLTASAALDRGQLFPNTLSGYVSLKRTW